MPACLLHVVVSVQSANRMAPDFRPYNNGTDRLELRVAEHHGVATEDSVVRPPANYWRYLAAVRARDDDPGDYGVEEIYRIY
jgi:hypothetical protein